MKKTYSCIILVLVCIILVLNGCSKTDRSDYDSIELGAIQYEKEYLENKTDQNLSIMCSHLSITRIDNMEINKMIIRYFPVLFSKFKAEDIERDFGFDVYYARYVSAIIAVNSKQEFYKQFYEYKNKAENIYYYSSCVFTDVLQITNLNNEDYNYLNNEAINLYEEAKKENVDFQSRLDAFSCLNLTYKAMGKEDELKKYEDEMQIEFDEYMETLN